MDQGKIEKLEKEIRYPEKLLYIYSGNSRGEGQVGGSPILIVLDEGALFEDKDGHSNALSLWDNLGAGGLVFKEDAKRCIISSAWCEGDALVHLYDVSKKSQGWIGFRLKSWMVNPIFAARDNPVVDDMYQSNEKMAQLLYEGIRSSTVNAFFDADRVEECFDIMSTLYASVDEIGPDRLVKLTINELAPASYDSYLHLDPAVVRDAYALAFGHGEKVNGEVHVFIDGMLAWEPMPGYNVSIVNVQEAIFRIRESRNIKKISADHKESAETLQRLRAAGFEVELITFSNPTQLKIYDVAKKLMNEGRLHLPKNSSWKRLCRDEFRNVELIKNIKIDHRPGFTKDLADAICTVCWHVLGNPLTMSDDVSVLHRSKLVLPNAPMTPAEQAMYNATRPPTGPQSPRDFVRQVRARKKPWSVISKKTL